MRLFRSKLAAVGLALIVVAVVLAVTAPLIAPADPNAQELTSKLRLAEQPARHRSARP